MPASDAPPGYASMPIVTKFSARFVAACRIQWGGNSQQRKLSSWDAHAFGPIALRPSNSANQEGPHEAAFGLFEDARPGRRRHGRGANPTRARAPAAEGSINLYLL